MNKKLIIYLLLASFAFNLSAMNKEELNSKLLNCVKFNFLAEAK